MTDTTAKTTTEVEFWIAVDDDGNFAVHVDGPQEANEELINGNNCHATRVFAMKLNLPLPKVVEVAATLPDTDGPVTVTVT